MGEASDDVFDAALRDEATAGMMRAAGCRRCTTCPRNGDECMVCHDLGWLDANGNPCEP